MGHYERIILAMFRVYISSVRGTIDEKDEAIKALKARFEAVFPGFCLSGVTIDGSCDLNDYEHIYVYPKESNIKVEYKGYDQGTFIGKEVDDKLESVFAWDVEPEILDRMDEFLTDHKFETMTFTCITIEY